MASDGYNGWTNYETWVTNLWLETDEGLYNDLKRCRSVDEIKSLVDDVIEATNGHAPEGFISDLINSALDEVDWFEILENVKEYWPEVESDESDETESER